jgi:hypothetical protein
VADGIDFFDFSVFLRLKQVRISLLNINPFLYRHLKKGIMQVGREHAIFGRLPFLERSSSVSSLA